MAIMAIIGTGMMGTSLALALKQSNVRNLEVVGTDYDGRVRSEAQKSGAFHRMEGRLGSAVRDADLVILATPVLAMKGLMEVIGPELREGCVVTDMGSSKKDVLDWAEHYLPKHVDFVGGHPMAGKEASGPENADGSLFDKKVYCIIPSPRAQKDAVSEVTSLAKPIGAQPFFIGVEEHDSFVAAASHLPFLLSVALVGCTSKSATWEDIAQLAATGYEDISRLASGDPIMHRDICVLQPRAHRGLDRCLHSGAVSDAADAYQRKRPRHRRCPGVLRTGGRGPCPLAGRRGNPIVTSGRGPR